MIELMFSLLSMVPGSFLFYCWTERVIARHESRVGKKIAFSGFLWQTAIDTMLEVRVRKPLWFWFLFGFQCSLPFLCGIKIEYLIFPWLILNGFLLAVLSPKDGNVLEKIDFDQKQVSFAVASGISLLCLSGGFTLSKTADLGVVAWSPLHLVFVIPFQIAGMILFQERPFRGFLERSSWIESVRFYGWCLVAVQAFLGGGEYFIDANLKAGVLFLISRLLAVYFPRLRQRDLIRVSTLYLFPLTGAIWLVVMLVFAMLTGEVVYV